MISLSGPDRRYGERSSPHPAQEEEKGADTQRAAAGSASVIGIIETATS